MAPAASGTFPSAAALAASSIAPVNGTAAPFAANIGTARTPGTVGTSSSSLVVSGESTV